MTEPATMGDTPETPAQPVETEPEEPHGQGAGGDEGGKPMTFWEHLEELRVRLIRSVIALFLGCVAAWTFHVRLLDTLVLPYLAAWTAAGLPGEANINQSAPMAGFIAVVKLALIGGAALAAPVIFYQLWAFVAPGLYAKEKKYIIPFVGFSTILFVVGGWFAWRVAIPLSLRFSLSFANKGAGHASITPLYMVDSYIDFCLQVMLGFGIAFELPMLLLFLSIAGVVNYLTLLRLGRWFIFLAFVVAAVLTPPDVPSQLVMAIPLCLLYGVSIGLVYLFGKPPTEAERAAWKNRKNKKAETDA